MNEKLEPRELVGSRELGRITPDEGAVLAAETSRDADFGKPVLIYPNLYLVRVPLPHNPLRALNSYFILDDDGTTTIVDVGFNHPDCERALSDALAVLGRSWDKVQVLLTHSHPDHTGNLDRIWQKDMPVLANLHSFQEVKNLMEMEGEVYGPLLLQAATLEQQRDMTFGEEGPRLHVSAELLPLSTYPVMTYVADGDHLRLGEFEFEVIETPGHDPWHICLYEASLRLLISGDHVLERITPSVSSWFPAHNALAKFLDSLKKVRAYDVDLVLPAHGKPFTDMRKRVDFRIEHHRRRLEEIYELVAAGRDDIVQISQHATWRYPDWGSWPLDQKYFSMGETLAHLTYLVREGRILQGICGHEYYFRMPYDRKNLALAPAREAAPQRLTVSTSQR